ncbi:hypothetical protein PGT21_032610 [Puccinia graminis f. sp. tritici]|uniref:Uncharacterized protein n=1 Tax=Puccinia graminis f. sp. tritici TaxID=56615 RepID=A0A5B0P656_PUCGR|nr:hypothetical protein PGT21_032610 [Puccinia graminis f. sp. tritici]KAA1107894.1 hypothetical protein PGTUg99_002253 [Puccinia graminis f. sp. tritici]
MTSPTTDLELKAAQLEVDLLSIDESKRPRAECPSARGPSPLPRPRVESISARGQRGQLPMTSPTTNLELKVIQLEVGLLSVDESRRPRAECPSARGPSLSFAQTSSWIHFSSRSTRSTPNDLTHNQPRAESNSARGRSLISR